MSEKIDVAMESMIRNLAEKTGKSLDEWVSLVRASGLGKHGEIVTMLKGEHGLGHGYANLVAHSAAAASAPPPPAGDDAVDAVYAGDKAGLRPIHDALMVAIHAFGGDVELAPKKGYVSLRRNKQFALIQPSTKTRVDLGLQLKGVPPEGRLEAAGSWNAMVSHRVRIEKKEEIDPQLIAWLRSAYERA